MNVGSGIFISGVTSLSLTSNIISGNRVLSMGTFIGGGGGLNVEDTDSVILTHNIISNNSAAGGGGGRIIASESITVTNNIIHHNSSFDLFGASGGGILLFADGATATITVTNNTISDNSASRLGGGLYLVAADNGFAEIYNNIIWNNNATLTGAGTNTGDDVFINNDQDGNLLPSVVNIFHNDYNQNAEGFDSVIDIVLDPSNLNVDPLFINPANGDYTLQLGSPAINAGTNQAPALPTTDKDFNARIAEGIAALLTSTHENKSDRPPRRNV